MKIIFASTNTDKLNELNAITKKFSVEFLSQSIYGVKEIKETGLSFIENALIKARHACSNTGLPTLADDSGLIVPFLNGAPGIYSSRYAGHNATSTNNIKKLLNELKNVPSKHRAAYFYCVLVFMFHRDDPAPILCEGKWQGKILTRPRGHEGFGYDPIFFLPKLKKTAAELPLSIKNRWSHRGQALHRFINRLKIK